MKIELYDEIFILLYVPPPPPIKEKRKTPRLNILLMSHIK